MGGYAFKHKNRGVLEYGDTEMSKKCKASTNIKNKYIMYHIIDPHLPYSKLHLFSIFYATTSYFIPLYFRSFPIPLDFLISVDEPPVSFLSSFS